MIKCPVCGQYEFGAADNYDVCDSCGWENDGMQLDDPDDWGGANGLSLNSARLEYLLLKNPATNHETQQEREAHINANSAIHIKYKDIDHRANGDKWSGELRKEYERYVGVLGRIAKQLKNYDGDRATPAPRPSYATTAQAV